MKLVRFGAPGREKPGIIDKNGKIRDLSKVVPDIAGDDALARRASPKSSKTDLDKLPTVKAGTRLGPCVGDTSATSSPSASTTPTTPPRPARRSRRSRSSSTRRRPASCGPNDDTIIPKGSTKLDYEVELGIVIGSRARYLSKNNAMDVVAGYCICQRRVRAQLPDRARRPMDQGQGLRDLRPARTLAGHQGRDQGPAEARHVARRQRPEAPERQHQDHDLRRRSTSSGTARSSS